MSEYPYLISIPSPGDIILIEDVKYLIIDFPKEVPWSQGRIIDMLVIGSNGKPIYGVVPWDYIGPGIYYKVIGKMIKRNGEWEPLNVAEQGEFVPMHERLTLEDRLPPDHPMRNLAYWEGPGGNNAGIIQGIEWLIALVEKMQGELPCKDNTETIYWLRNALAHQLYRQRLRREQGLLGTKFPHKELS